MKIRELSENHQQIDWISDIFSSIKKISQKSIKIFEHHNSILMDGNLIFTSKFKPKLQRKRQKKCINFLEKQKIPLH
jgi:hypothetical protein